MISSVAAVLLFGLAVVNAQINPNPNVKPDAVIVKKFYGTPPGGFRGGFVQSGFQQPYPYQSNYYQGSYNQYRGQYASPAPIPVVASPAPVYSVTAAPVPKAPSPVQYAAGRTGVSDKDARILSEERNVDFDGTFKYAFQTDNGISVNAEGFVKQPTADSEGPIQVIQGSYTLYTPEGVPVVISYIADENGYRAAGDAIPTPPPELAQAYANAPVEKQRK